MNQNLTEQRFEESQQEVPSFKTQDMVLIVDGN